MRAPAVYLACLLLLVAPSTFADEPVLFSPEPTWLRPVPLPADLVVQPAIDGQRFLMVDRQVNLEAKQVTRFSRYMIEVTSTEGLERASQLTFDFDPAYESLTIHKVRVFRQGQVLDRLEPSELRLFQREADLARFLYSGQKTGLLILPDIRVGDVLEYSYSIAGLNPVMAGRYSEQFQLDWSSPVAVNAVRLLVTPSRALYYLAPELKEGKLEVLDNAGEREILWRETQVAGVQGDAQTPAWFTPHRYLSVSEFASWGAVVEWARPLYEQAAVIDPAVKALADQLAASADSPAGRVAAAVQFVQQEVRYLGIEDGIGSHRPRLAADTLYRRYGDCKDKTVLLLALLKAMGFAPQAALVSLEQGAALPRQLPNPYAFDHVVVTLMLDGQRYWLDGTNLNQGARLESMGVPYYRHALILAEGEQQLTSMDAEYRRPAILQQHEIWVGATQSQLLVSSRYLGEQAEQQRSQWQNSDIASLGRSLLDYYRGFYPGLQGSQAPQIHDDRQANELTVREQYQWPLGADSLDQDTGLELYADLLDGYLKSVEGERRHPLELGAPVRLRQQFLLHLPADWAIAPYQSRLDNPVFLFEVEVEPLQPKLLRVRYRYESRLDHVPVSELARYRANVERARDLLGLSIAPPPPQASQGTPGTP